MQTVRIVLSLACAVAVVPAARADRQVIAPGTGLQSATELDWGANGICETPEFLCQSRHLRKGNGADPH